MSYFLPGNIGRRTALKGLGTAAIGASSALPLTALSANAAPLSSGQLNLDDPKDNLYAWGKIWGSYDSPVIGSFHGLMYARIGNKRMVPVFGFAGTGVLDSHYDPIGKLTLRSREAAFFTDLVTGEVLEQWDNPFTGETVDVYHFYNHVFKRSIGTEMPIFPIGEGRDDKPTLINEGTSFPDETGIRPYILPRHKFGNDLMISWDYTHEYTNPVTPEGWPKASVGRTITPSEHFTFQLDYDKVVDRDIPSNRFVAGFSRQSNWWPWMRMGQSGMEDGVLFGRMFSHKGLPGTDDVYRPVLDYLERHAPEFLTMPDGLDTDANRLDVAKTYAQDVPPENPDYEWVEKRPARLSKPPTGLGSQF